eukprot:756475-Hanusia_phi.AAC.3
MMWKRSFSVCLRWATANQLLHLLLIREGLSESLSKIEEDSGFSAVNEENSACSPGNPSRNSSADLSESSNGNQEDSERWFQFESVQEHLQKDTSISGGFWSKGEAIHVMPNTKQTRPKLAEQNGGPILKIHSVGCNVACPPELEIDLQIDIDSPIFSPPKTYEYPGASLPSLTSSHGSRSNMTSM